MNPREKRHLSRRLMASRSRDAVLKSVTLTAIGQDRRAVPMAYGGSQARGRIIAIAADLHHNHSNEGFELHLRPIPPLMAMPDP